MINKIINLILIIITYFLSFLVKKDKNLYIFGSSDGYSFSGNSKEIFNFFKKKGNKKIIYLSFNKKFSKIIGKKNFCYAGSFRAYFLLLRANLIFIDSSIKFISKLYAIIGNFKIVLLWHGDGFKKIEFENPYFKKQQNILGIWLLKKQYKNIVLGVTGNSFNKETFNKSFVTNNFKVLGLPRNIVFLKNNINFTQNIENILNKKYKKIILYAPTWRDSLHGKDFKPLSNIFFKKLNSFLSKNNYIFLFKPHPLSKVSYINTENIKILNSDYDTQELLKISDILITDYSSIFIDYLLTDKPILFYTYDYNEYIKKDKDLYFPYKDIIIPGGNIDNEDGIINAINNINKISRNSKYIKKYLELKSFFHQYEINNILKNLEKEIQKID